MTMESIPTGNYGNDSVVGSAHVPLRDPGGTRDSMNRET